MSIREQIEEHPKAAAILCLAGVVAVMGYTVIPWIWNLLHPPRKPVTTAYYYDLANNELVAGPMTAAPPIARPDQPNGPATCVRAYVFSCHDCSDEYSRFVGYLFKFNDSYKKQFDAAPEPARHAYIAPQPFILDSLTLPALSAQPDSASGMDESRILIANAPPLGGKPRWRKPALTESSQLLQSLKNQCDGEDPVPCDPPE